jgi:hypothetical protein
LDVSAAANEARKQWRLIGIVLQYRMRRPRSARRYLILLAAKSRPPAPDRKAYS